MLGFYQILVAVTSTLNIIWPPLTLNFLIWMRLLTLDLPVLPFVGCLSRSSFVNSFFITISGPPVLIAIFVLLYKLELQSYHEVWRNAIYVLFLCCQSPSPPSSPSPWLTPSFRALHCVSPIFRRSQNV